MTPLEIFTAILNSFWQATALAALVWLTLKWARVNAATRCVIWWAALAVLIVLPTAPRFTMPYQRPSESTANTSNRAATTPAASYPSLAEAELPPAIVTLPEKPAAKWPWIAVAVCAVVFLFRLGRVIQSYLLLRGVKRKSTPSDFPLPDIGRNAHILISSDIASPMAVGFLHPAIILPEDLSSSMTREELDQIVLHEAAHLARRDDWWNLIARLLGAALALHPVAWWILRQIEYEREAACDDWVVARTGAARLYAETLAHIVELRWATDDSRRSEALASGVFGRGSRIGERIETLLKAGRQFSPRVSGMRVAAGVFVLLFLAGAGSLAPRWIAFAKTPALQRFATLTLPSAVSPQARIGASPQFDAASIKPSHQAAGSADLKFVPGRVFGSRITTRQIIQEAYYPLTDYQIFGGPDWLDVDTFDLDAKSETAGTGQLRTMLRALLAERFKLIARSEMKEMPVYALTVANRALGPQILPIKMGDPDPPDETTHAMLARRASTLRAPRRIGIRGNMEDFVYELSAIPAIRQSQVAAIVERYRVDPLSVITTRPIDRPAINKTGLKGQYFILLAWNSDEDLKSSLVETTGLKLVSERALIDTLTIDRIEKPHMNQ